MPKHRAHKRFALGTGAALVLSSVISVIALSSPASGADPNGVSFGLEGCRNDGSITLPDGNGDFICPDAVYTDGNLGKGWSELDLVPLRVIADAGNSAPSSQTYTIAIAVDSLDDSTPGFDFISEATVNAALSHASCSVSSGSPQTVGTTDQTLFRFISITQAANSTCVIDYFARLALGSHLFPGASLHANLLNENLGNSGIGQKTNSILSNEIAPQGLSKTMTATQDSEHVWNVTKSPTPASLDFADTCDPNGSLSQPVAITVTWTKLPASPSGDIDVISNVYATNPASRAIDTSVSDQIYSGANPIGLPATSGQITVPANTASFLILTHQTTVPSGTTNLNDVATATYIDTVTQIPIPGSVTAVASASVQPGALNNGSATISDVESISGGLSYSVDSVTGASGSFNPAYTLGTETTGDVTWISDSQSDSGSVTFNKTVYADAATIASGSLDDTATLNGSEGFTTDDDLEVGLSSSALVDLTINKRRSPVSADAQTFDFDVVDSNDVVVASPSITVPGGTAANADTSTTVNNLQPGTYDVDEAASGPYPAQSASATLAPDGTQASCSESVSFTNSAAPATARVLKVTNPAGSEAGWTFTLTGPGIPAQGEPVTTTGTGFVDFASSLQEGTYTVTETTQASFDLTGVTVQRNAGTPVAQGGTCTFTVAYPADVDAVYSCRFTNTQRGALKVTKTVIVNDSGNTLTGTFTICITGPSYPAPTVQNGGCQTTTIAGGDLTWTNLLPGTYTVSEADPGTSWIVGINPTSVNVAAGSTASATASTVTNTHKGRVRVVKTVSNHDGSNAQPPSGTESFTFEVRTGTTDILGNPGTLVGSGVANAGNGGQFTFSALLTPGQVYQVCETGLDPAWMVQLTPGPQFVPEQWTDQTRTVLNPNVVNDVYCVNFTAQAGPDPTVITVNNRRPPEGFALTIGYWKNHAACSTSKGGQDATLNQVLASFPIASGQTTHGVYIGDVYVDTCLEAVRLLNKSTINGNKKFASDPLFNLAAQLLAAKLNVQAGAGTCPAAITAINAGQALLDQHNFTGSATVKLKSAQVASANAIARDLDRYNNNVLC